MLDLFSYNDKGGFFISDLLEVTALEEMEFFESSGIEEFVITKINLSEFSNIGSTVKESYAILELIIYIAFIHDEIDELEDTIEEHKKNFKITNLSNDRIRFLLGNLNKKLSKFKIRGAFIGWYKTDRRNVNFDALYVIEKE